MSCTIKRDFQYNRVMPTFHHWRTGNMKYGLTFQTAADARAFHAAVQQAVDDLLSGKKIISISWIVFSYLIIGTLPLLVSTEHTVACPHKHGMLSHSHHNGRLLRLNNFYLKVYRKCTESCLCSHSCCWEYLIIISVHQVFPLQSLLLALQLVSSIKMLRRMMCSCSWSFLWSETLAPEHPHPHHQLRLRWVSPEVPCQSCTRSLTLINASPSPGLKLTPTISRGPGPSQVRDNHENNMILCHQHF